MTLCTPFFFFKCKKLCFCCKIILSIFICLVTILITEGVQNLHKHVLGFLYGVTILMRFQEYAQNRNVAGGDHSYEGIPIFPCKSVTRGSHTHGKMVTRVTKILNFPVRLVTRGA